MLSKAFIRKFENQVAKKMNKGFHPESYCCVDRVVVEVGDCEGYYTIQVRCGYYYGEDNSKYKQTNFTFAFDINTITSPKELAAIMYVKAVMILDEYNPFEVIS